MKNKIIITVFLFSFYNSFAGSLSGKIKLYEEALSNVVVYLIPLEKNGFNPSKKTAVMDQINLNFVPHVLPVQIGTTVIFPNSDKIRHSVFSFSKIKEFDFGTYPPGTEKSIVCNKAGVIPILCYIHHDMSAYIVVLETPYFSLTNENGIYNIKDVPSGNYTLSFWSENIEIKSQKIFIPSKETITKNISIE